MKQPLKWGGAAWIWLFLSAVPTLGCGVCFEGGGADGARYAYYLTTVALILLPLGLAGSFALWIAHQSDSDNPQKHPGEKTP